MKFTFASLWLLLTALLLEFNASQAGLITVGERLAGSIPALACMALIPAIFIAILVLFVRFRKRVLPTPAWWLPVVFPLIALVPFMTTSQTQDEEAKKVLTIVAGAIRSPQTPAAISFEREGGLPRCSEPDGLLSLNHSTPFLREYTIWLQCGDKSVQEIRLVRMATRLVVTSVFTPRPEHVRAFSGRARIIVPIRG